MKRSTFLLCALFAPLSLTAQSVTNSPPQRTAPAPNFALRSATLQPHKLALDLGQTGVFAYLVQQPAGAPVARLNLTSTGTANVTARDSVGRFILLTAHSRGEATLMVTFTTPDSAGFTGGRLTLSAPVTVK